MTTLAKTDMRQSALKIVAEGFKVIPLCNAMADGKCGCGRGHEDKAIGKVPLTNHGLKDCTQTQLGVKEYWAKYPQANIGIVTDGLIVLDFDAGHGGLDSKNELEAKYGLLPRTRRHRTGGGGQHWLYRAPSGVVVRNTTGLAGYQGIDTRANGGYIVAPPSLHPSGNRYEVLDDCDITPAPEWLVTLATQRSTAPLPPPGDIGQIIIPEGQRNAHLTSLAGSMRRRGMPQSAIEAALLEVNYSQCQAPLPENEVLAIARSVSRYTPGEQRQGTQPTFNDTDTGNAERFAAMFGNIVHYVEEYRIFAIYNTKFWELDYSGNRILSLSKDVARSFYQDASKEVDDNKRAAIAKHAKQAQSLHRRQAMIELLKAESGISTKIAAFDNDTYLLNCRNGTIDLTTGELRPHKKTDMITKFINLDYDPDAASNLWQQFLVSTFQNKPHMITYLQRSLGYSCTASMGSMAFFNPYGQGWNGKSTLLGAVGDTLGEDYAAEVDPAVFMVNLGDRGGGPNESIANLYKKRFVRSTEIKDGQKLSTDLIKRATGGEQLSHNKKYQHEFQYTPTFKLWLSGNHRATITDSTDSIWLRLKQIPFEAKFRPGQPEFNLNMRHELSQPDNQKAILAWLVKGAVAWFNRGKQLQEPDEVIAATQEYRQDMDLLADFLIERCYVGSECEILATELWNAYKAWCESNDRFRLGQHKFYERLREKGLKDYPGNSNKKYFRGIRLLEEGESVIFAKNSYDVLQKNTYEEIPEKIPEKDLIITNKINSQAQPDTKKLTPLADDIPEYPPHPCPKCGSEWAISPKGQYVCENPECGFLHPLDCSRCLPGPEGGNGQ